MHTIYYSGLIVHVVFLNFISVGTGEVEGSEENVFSPLYLKVTWDKARIILSAYPLVGDKREG